MATEKQRFSVTVDDTLYRKIEDFRFEKRIKSQSKAVNELMKIGFDSLSGKDTEMGPSFSSFEIGIIEKYNSLDKHGREIIDFILQKECERCSELPPEKSVIDDVKEECRKMDLEYENMRARSGF
nr:MAG TPA: bifunctional protein PutA [Caudoviricetes sp.]